jgi:CBS domain-containing protein
MDLVVERLMTRDPVLVHDDAPIETAGALMLRRHFRHLPVVNRDGRLVGLVDDAAVFARGEWVSGKWRMHDRRDGGLRVADVLRPAPIVLRPGMSAAEALRPMVELGEDAAVIIDGERRPMGIFTAHDAVRSATSVLPPGLDTEDIGRHDVLTVETVQPVGAALDTMRAHSVRHLVVLGKDHRPWAVISWRELVELDADQRRTALLSSLRPGAVETVLKGASLQDVAEQMVVQKVGSLPVVDDHGRLVGLVSRSDLMVRMLGALGPD